jgi:hypothetical protein
VASGDNGSTRIALAAYRIQWIKKRLRECEFEVAGPRKVSREGMRGSHTSYALRAKVSLGAAPLVPIVSPGGPRQLERRR